MQLLQYAGFLGGFHTTNKISKSYVGPGWAVLEQIRIFWSFSVVVGCFCLFVVPRNIHVTVAEFDKFVVFIEDLVVLWDLGKYSGRV